MNWVMVLLILSNLAVILAFLVANNENKIYKYKIKNRLAAIQHGCFGSANYELKAAILKLRTDITEGKI